MTERSRSFTDFKIWIQSLLTVALIVVGGYFGATMLAPESPAPSEEAQSGATLEAYQPAQLGDGENAGEAPDGENAGEPSDSETSALPDADATEPVGEEPNATGEQPDTMGTPEPPDSSASNTGATGSQGAARPDAPGDRAPGVRMTEIAQGTMLPAGPAAGDDALQQLQARMTAIAQGTLRPGDPAGAGAAETPVPTAAPVQEPPTAIAPAGGAGQEPASGGTSAGGASSPAASRLFAVTRGGGGALYDRPDGDVVSDLVAGAALTALARSDDGQWALVQGTDGAGWVPVDQLVLFGAENLPVLSDLETAAGQPSAEQVAASQAQGGQAPAPAAPAQQTPGQSAGQTVGAAGETAPILGDYIEPVLATVASLNNRLNVRTGPGPDFNIVERVNPGEQYIALARTASGDWVQIALPESEAGAGWVSADFVDLSGGIEALPALDTDSDSAAPAALPTPTPIESGAASGTPPSGTDTAGTDTATTDTAAAQTALSTGADAGEGVAQEAAALALRTGPGTDFAIEQEVDGGARFIELDRTADGAWTRIGVLDWPGGIGWVPTEQLKRDMQGDSAGEGSALASAASADIGVLSAIAPQAEVEAAASAPAETNVDASGALTAAQPASATGAVFPEPVVATVTTQGARLNVRTGPGTEFDVVERLDPGMVRTALAQNATGDWTRIASPQAPDGEAWVATQFVQLGGLAADAGNAVTQAPEPLPATPALENAGLPLPPLVFGPDTLAGPAYATVNAGGETVDIRSGPGSAFAPLGQAVSGAQFLASARSVVGDWVQVRLSDTGALGWLPAESVSLDAPVMLLPTGGPDLQPPPEFVEDLTWGAPPQAEDVDPLRTAEETTPGPLANVAQGNVDAAHSATKKEMDEAQDIPDPPQYLPVVGDDLDSAAAFPGGMLVFGASNGGQIYGYNLDTGTLWPIATGFDPAISPDGSTVAFTRDGGDHGLYLVDIDGANQRLIYSGGQRLASPKWSPDGSEIIFSHGYDAYQCIPFGSGCTPVEELGDRPLPDDVQPMTWVNYHLAVVDVDGRNYRELATLESARAPDWNEAGVVYQSAAGLQRTADEPNASSRLILFDYLKPFFHDPDWQPGGGRIVYQGKEASHWELFSVNPDGSGVASLTRPKTTLVDELPSNVAPAWSPDGRAIVFLSNRTESGEAGDWRLWVMDADGGNQRPLPVDVPITYTFGDEQAVSWGP